jgi:dihydropteroate synthase
MRPRFTWQIGRRTLALGERTLVMGVINVTPDSFSDGGAYFAPNAAMEHGLRLLEEGADILDIGGESTRPGASTETSADEGNVRPSVSEEEELRRILPVINGLKQRRPEALLSVDTYKSGVAAAAVEAGADILNDISGFRWDDNMATTVARLGCGVVLMHTRGRPHQWRKLPPVDDMVALVCRELGKSKDAALAAGVRREAIVLDPGFGFGKNYEENHPLLKRFDEFHALGFPLMAGVSRKSFIGKLLSFHGAAPAPDQRLAGSLAAAVICAIKGAHIIRAHDVRETVQAMAVVDGLALFSSETKIPSPSGTDSG